MGTLQFFHDTTLDLYNPHIQTWKKEGKPVVGLTCTSIPEELLHAAGVLPIRLRAYDLPDTSRADSHLHSIVCSYSRGILDLQLSGKLDFLDGIVATNTCDHHMRLAGQLEDKSDYTFFHYFSMYHTLTAGAREWFRGEMEKMIDRIEESFGQPISQDQLNNTISVYNRTRQLMMRLNEFRKSDPSPISGSDYLKVVLAGMSMPKELFNDHLEELLTELGQSKSGDEPRPRLLIMGGACDAPGFIRFVESKGSTVVADDSCFGLRFYQGLMAENTDDPLDAIVDRYFNRLPCPSVIDGFDFGYQNLKEIINDWGIQGIVNARIKFCDHWSVAGKILRDVLSQEKEKVPLLDLEREYNTEGSGQISTRVQAFLELL